MKYKHVSVLDGFRCLRCEGRGWDEVWATCGLCTGDGRMVTGDPCLRCDGEGGGWVVVDCPECGGRCVVDEFPVVVDGRLQMRLPL